MAKRKKVFQCAKHVQKDLDMVGFARGAFVWYFLFIDDFIFVHVSRKAFSITRVILKMPKYTC